jgi:hypothetical protein
MTTSLDTFQRPDQENWGIASDGHPWYDDRDLHPGGRFYIRQGLGYVDTLTAETDLDLWMGDRSPDALISADFQVLNYWHGHPQRGARLLGRVTDAHHFVVFAINFSNSTLQLWVNQNNHWWMLQQVRAAAFHTQQWYHARLLLAGTRVAGKVWPGGASEPDWQIAGSQSALTAGMGGLRTTYSQVYWANFSVQPITMDTSPPAAEAS